MSTKLAVMIPCYNEELTIRKVVNDFRLALPDASIHVFDNNSSDLTQAEATAAGASVHFVPARGKGWVVRSMFREVDADVYIIVDGDGTYPAHRVNDLITPILEGKAEMVVGTRLHDYHEQAFPRLHKFGNNLVLRTINTLFGSKLSDVLSGYRAFSRRFVKTMPVLSKGFEIETEMTLHALENGLAIKEVSIAYGTRPEGSRSKLNTFTDGWRVLKAILWIFKDYRPLLFFGVTGLVIFLLGIISGVVVLNEFAATAKVTHPSTAVLAATLCTVGLLCMTTGLILDTVNRRSREQYILLADHLLKNVK